MNKEAKFFIGQIYLKSGKNTNHYKITKFNNECNYNDMNINKDLKEIVDNGYRHIEWRFITYIIFNLPKQNGPYYESQKIELLYNDDNLREQITSNKKQFYEGLNNLVEKNVLVKYKRGCYQVNPYYIDNLSATQWEELRKDANNLWLERQGIRQTD